MTQAAFVRAGEEDSVTPIHRFYRERAPRSGAGGERDRGALAADQRDVAVYTARGD